MVCAMHRMFQSEEDDRIMEGDFDPEVERMKRDAAEKQTENTGWLTRAIHRLLSKSGPKTSKMFR